MPNNQYYLKSLGNALQIVDLFDQHRKSLTIAEIVALSNFDRATVNRIVQTLYQDGYLEKQDKKYYLSHIFLQLGNAYLQGSNIEQTIHNEMAYISEKYCESTFLFANRNNKHTLLDWYEPTGASYQRSKISDILPINCSSIGKVFMSQFKDSQIRSIMNTQGFYKCTDKSICEIEAFLDEIHLMQKNGYARCLGEITLETDGLGIPIYDYAGNIAFAISFSYSCPIQDELLNKIIADLLNSGKKLSTMLGHNKYK